MSEEDGAPGAGALGLEAAYRDQHKLRLSWMPWLYFSLKPSTARREF